MLMGQVENRTKTKHHEKMKITVTLNRAHQVCCGVTLLAWYTGLIHGGVTVAVCGSYLSMVTLGIWALTTKELCRIHLVWTLEKIATKYNLDKDEIVRTYSWTPITTMPANKLF
jgi:hypothetical protein